MRKILQAACAALVLSGCAHPFDEDAVPAASAKLRLAYDLCAAKLTRNEITTSLGGIECALAADRIFAQEIKLQNLTFYETYAARMRNLGALSDAGRLSDSELASQYKAIKQDYADQLMAEYRNDLDRRMRAAAALGAFGQSMQQAAANQAAIAAAYRPVNCTSTRSLNTVYTNCY